MTCQQQMTHHHLLDSGMHLARNQADPQYKQRGAQGGPCMVAFTSEHAHYSYLKAAFVTGLPFWVAQCRLCIDSRKWRLTSSACLNDWDAAVAVASCQYALVLNLCCCVMSAKHVTARRGCSRRRLQAKALNGPLVCRIGHRQPHQCCLRCFRSHAASGVGAGHCLCQGERQGVLPIHCM